MASIDDLEHTLREPASGDPAGALVLLHGRGVDEHDLVPLLSVLDPQRRLVGITPRAPLELPPGGNHWYVVSRVGYPDPSTFHPTRELLAGWLDALPGELGVPYERIVLGGFSQGAVMSYAMALGAGRPAPAGLIALSGFIPTVEGFALDLQARQGYPVWIAHGELDPVIGVEFGRDANERLTAGGLDVTYRESPMGHSIDPRTLPDLGRWVSDRLGLP
jgi:phospholipase/carboxylesterase